MHCFNSNATPIRFFALTSVAPNNPKMQFAVSFCGGAGVGSGSSSSTALSFPESSSHICSCPSSVFPRNVLPKTCLKWPSSLNRPVMFPSARASVSVSENPQTENGEPASASAAAATDNQDSSSSSSDTFGNSARRSADWKAARAYQEKSLIYEGRVEDFNTGGLLIRFYSLVGFVPFPQLAPSHTYTGPKKNSQDTARGLVGSVIRVKVIKADERNRQLIFSEKEAVWCKYSKDVKVGDIFEGKVGSVEEYGAFVHLRFPDGGYHVTGLVHVSEASWDLVKDCRDILREGDDVRVKIINIDRRKSRMTLSIKQLEQDPLLETLDKVIPQDGCGVGGDSLECDDDDESISNIDPLPGLDDIFQELVKEEGIEDVRISRQGFEKRVVSPDLQLWLSNAPPVENTFVLLARAGRQVQEIQLTTSLDQQGIKAALQRVLERVP